MTSLPLSQSGWPVCQRTWPHEQTTTFRAALPCHQSRSEAGDRHWRPIVHVETPLELDTPQPLQLDRDGPPNLVIEKEDPDVTREHHSRLAHLPPKASARGRESLIRRHFPGGKGEHMWSSTGLSHPSVMSGRLQTPSMAEIAARSARANERPSSQEDHDLRKPRTSGATSLSRQRCLARTDHVSGR
jgi:hypothetical protein